MRCRRCCPISEHEVRATKNKKNETVIVVPEDAEPGDTLVIKYSGPPIYCFECGKNSIELEPGSYVSIPTSRLMELRRAKPSGNAATGDEPKPEPSSFTLD